MKVYYDVSLLFYHCPLFDPLRSTLFCYPHPGKQKLRPRGFVRRGGKRVCFRNSHSGHLEKIDWLVSDDFCDFLRRPIILDSCPWPDQNTSTRLHHGTHRVLKDKWSHDEINKKNGESNSQKTFCLCICFSKKRIGVRKRFLSMSK
jgi:hypothetical protein